jgi:UDP-N-acetyl-D-glucosamine dehydrogenase
VELLRDEGANVSYYDPHVPELPEQGLSSSSLDGALEAADCVAIVTAHSGIDYDDLTERAKLVVDFRNATGANGSLNGRVWKL